MENQLKKMAKFNKKRNHGRGWWVNPSAGDVPKANTFFNHASGSSVVDTGNAGGDGASSCGVGESLGKGKDEIFGLIKEINPNAKENNYKNKDVNQMLAILSDMRKGKKKYDKDRFVGINPDDLGEKKQFTGVKKDWEDGMLYHYQDGVKGELATEEEGEPEYYENH